MERGSEGQVIALSLHMHLAASQNLKAASGFVLKQKLPSLSTSKLRIWSSPSVQACPEFICFLHHLPCYKNIILQHFNQNSPTVPMLLSQTHQSLSETVLPAPASSSSRLWPCHLGLFAEFSISNTWDLPFTLSVSFSWFHGHTFPRSFIYSLAIFFFCPVCCKYLVTMEGGKTYWEF
jgi:hypothetical protein